MTHSTGFEQSVFRDIRVAYFKVDINSELKGIQWARDENKQTKCEFFSEKRR